MDNTLNALTTTTAAQAAEPLPPSATPQAGTPPEDESFDFSTRLGTTDDEPTAANGEIGLFIVKTAAQTMEDASSRPTPRKLFGQLWYERETCILFADTGVGKTILAYQIAEAVSSGKPTLNMDMEVDAQTVIYFDFELSEKQFEKRFTAASGQRYQFSPNLFRAEINPDADYPDDFSFEDCVKESLQRAVEATGARVIVVDNITFLNQETEKAKDALPLMKWLKQFSRAFELSTLVLAHTPKRNMSNPLTRNDLQGSKMLINFTDSSFAIGESSKDKSVRYIKEIKGRNDAAKYDAGNVIVCEIANHDGHLKFHPIGFSSEAEHLRSFTENDRAELAARAKELSGRGLAQRAIAAELGVSAGTVNNYLNKL